jgi:hypothetical protein
LQKYWWILLQAEYYIARVYGYNLHSVRE